MDPSLEHEQHLTRRHFFGRGRRGAGHDRLASLLDRDLFGGRSRGSRPGRRGHRGIPQLRPQSQAGDLPVPVRRASQMDLFDPKPGLDRLQGTDLPDSVRMGQRLTGMTSRQDRFPVAASRFQFAVMARAARSERAPAAHGQGG